MCRIVCAVSLLVAALSPTRSVVRAPDPSALPSSSAHRDAIPRARLEEGLGKMPLYFIENHGQLDPRVAYAVHGRDAAIYFSKNGVTFSLLQKAGAESSSGTLSRASFGSRSVPERVQQRRWNLKLDFIDTNPRVEVLGREKMPAVVSYFKGNREEWKSGLSTYSSILYRDVWPGIDLLYSGTVDHLKYRFVVMPGADPERIRLAYRGATRVGIDREGRLQVETPGGGLSDDRPHSYQQIGSRRIEIDTEYALSRSTHSYGFRVGAYDESRPLVIDPSVLVYAGFIGGSGNDQGFGIALDGSGNAYVTGDTFSTEETFPETLGPDVTSNGSFDAFVAKVAADGASLVYAGYIGGAGNDHARGIAVDGSGNAYVTGFTSSTEATFPKTVGPDLTFNGVEDAFVAKLTADGTGLVYAGYIGGSNSDFGWGVAVDHAGYAYVTGDTFSTEATFPVIGGPDLTSNGANDAFVAKVASDGTSLAYAGFVGGSVSDGAFGIAVDDFGNAYLAGFTFSNEETFPVIGGPDLTFNGLKDAFVAKVALDGASLAYAGFIGGSSEDGGLGIAVDGSGNAYVTGQTFSTEATFPAIEGPDLTFNGGEDAFVAKVTEEGTSFAYAGFIGGSSFDFGRGIAVDGSGNAYVTGRTFSTEATFPAIDGPDSTSNGANDAFIAKVTAGGNSLVYSGFIGGFGGDVGWSVAVNGFGDAYVTGQTLSTEATFPAVEGPDLTFNGGGDAFVAKVAEVGPTPTPTPTPTAAEVPALSFPMLLLLALGLVATALFLIRTT